MQRIIIDSSMNLCEGCISLPKIEDEIDVDNDASDTESKDEDDDE